MASRPLAFQSPGTDCKPRICGKDTRNPRESEIITSPHEGTFVFTPISRKFDGLEKGKGKNPSTPGTRGYGRYGTAGVFLCC